MCGIVGYIGGREAAPIVINGLKRLEYRGYDSAGIALRNGTIQVLKCTGKVAELEEIVHEKGCYTNIAIGHTRWATHGVPCDNNAHPHVSNHGKVTLIHNGIIENYSELKTVLAQKGVTFYGDTDTEVLANWIEHVMGYCESHKPEDILEEALMGVTGAFGLAILLEDFPDKIFATRRGSPLVVGLGEDEYFIGSDASPFIEYTNRVIYLADDDLIILSRTSFSFKSMGKVDTTIPAIKKLLLSAEDISKSGFDYFMAKEIFEQPKALENTLRGRIENGVVHLGGLAEVEAQLKSAKRLMIVACGTSWHAGLIGEYLMEKFARLNVEVDYASEFRYRDPVIHPGDLMLVISQSGETADTLAAMRMAKEKGAIVLSVCNVVGSSIAREATAGIFTYAGPEIGVASTKAFVTQVAAMVLFTLHVAQLRQALPADKIKEILDELEAVPSKIEWLLAEKNDKIKAMAAVYAHHTNALFLGRGYNYPVALEGALKLKEISYIHAEGYPAAEMKHGPIALIDENMPVFFIAPQDSNYDKIVSNIQEVKARKGVVISLISPQDTTVRDLSDHYIILPETHEALTPLLAVVPLQLFSYYVAIQRGCNVDQPRNLAKSVTVE